MTFVMNNIDMIRKTLLGNGWFMKPGAYVLVDGQFGSTGKGLLAGVIAEAVEGRINVVTTNAGPNSGHTTYFGEEKIMTQQIPVASVVLRKMGLSRTSHLNAGAVIDLDILANEVAKYDMSGVVTVDPDAAVIDDTDRGHTLSHIASTGKGVGPAMAKKLMRGGIESVMDGHPSPDGVLVNRFPLADVINDGETVFVETAQGFSLGINSGFYPYCTSRECTVGQALADARIPAQFLMKSIATLRTYPIRVGNTPDGFSGGWYPDQKETSFEELGKEPELTTVTKRVRRIATFSFMQYAEMLQVNRPDALFLNFCNYMSRDELDALLTKMMHVYHRIMRRAPDTVLLGFGPKPKDVKVGYVTTSGSVYW